MSVLQNLLILSHTIWVYIWCCQEEDLDCQQGVIDFSLYLRSSHHMSTGDSPEDELDPDNMTTVLDQKNYIEELNRHLKWGFFPYPVSMPILFTNYLKTGFSKLYHYVTVQTGKFCKTYFLKTSTRLSIMNF